MSESLHIVCPYCQTTNRVRTADLRNSPDCGSCHKPLFAGKSLALDEAGFERHLTRSQIPLLVDFWAPWCGPCLQMAPAFEQAAAALEPQLRLAKVNSDEAGTLSARYNIRSIPTLVLFQDGRELARQSGAMGNADIQRWVRSKLPA